MKRLSLVISFCITSLLYGCFNDPYGHDSIIVTNNSNNDIYVDASCAYLDTFFYSFGVVHYNDGYRVPAYSTCEAAHVRGTWEGAAEQVGTDTIIVFFIDAVFLDSLILNNLIDFGIAETGFYLNDYAVLRRDCFSLHDLDSLNWTLTYP